MYSELRARKNLYRRTSANKFRIHHLYDDAMDFCIILKSNLTCFLHEIFQGNHTHKKSGICLLIPKIFYLNESIQWFAWKETQHRSKLGICCGEC